MSADCTGGAHRVGTGNEAMAVRRTAHRATLPLITGASIPTPPHPDEAPALPGRAAWLGCDAVKAHTFASWWLRGLDGDRAAPRYPQGSGIRANGEDEASDEGLVDVGRDLLDGFGVSGEHCERDRLD